MIEIILIIVLSQRNARIAAGKGLSSRKWLWLTVLAWIALELPAVILSYGYTQNLITASFSGLLGGFLGYFIVKRKLNSLPPDIDSPFDNQTL